MGNLNLAELVDILEKFSLNKWSRNEGHDYYSGSYKTKISLCDFVVDVRVGAVDSSPQNTEEDILLIVKYPHKDATSKEVGAYNGELVVCLYKELRSRFWEKDAGPVCTR